MNPPTCPAPAPVVPPSPSLPPRPVPMLPPPGFKGLVYRATRLPTSNPFLNLGLTAFVVFLVVKAIAGREYEAYLVSTAYSIAYLAALLWARPLVARE